MFIPRSFPGLPLLDAAPLFRTEQERRAHARHKNRVKAAYFSLDRPLRDYLSRKGWLKGVIVGTDFRRGLLPLDSPVRRLLPASLAQDGFFPQGQITPMHMATPGEVGRQPSEMYIFMPQTGVLSGQSYNLTRSGVRLYFKEEMGHVLDYVLGRKGTHIVRHNAASAMPGFLQARERDLAAIKQGISQKTFTGSHLMLLANPLSSAEETFAKVFASFDKYLKPWTSQQQASFAQKYLPMGMSPDWAARIALGQDIQLGRLSRLDAGVPQPVLLEGELADTHFRAVAEYFPETRRYVQDVLSQKGLIQVERHTSRAAAKKASQRAQSNPAFQSPRPKVAF